MMLDCSLKVDPSSTHVQVLKGLEGQACCWTGIFWPEHFAT